MQETIEEYIGRKELELGLYTQFADPLIERIEKVISKVKNMGAIDKEQRIEELEEENNELHGVLDEIQSLARV